MWRRIADWCVPDVFPRHLTEGDRRYTALGPDGSTMPVHTWDDGRIEAVPHRLTEGEYERLKARWLAAHGRGSPMPL